MPQISVCMIVKNEELVLVRCLDSLKGIADEIILVDTGSTDATKTIAAQYTDKIFDFPWTGDFSDARNFAFSKAEKDYIYSADADEIIDEENREKFLSLKESLPEQVEIVLMQYGNQLQFNTTYNFETENRPKLFKRLRPFRWVDPVHEMVDMHVHIFESDILVRHMPEKNHAARDFSIFRRAVEARGTLSARLHGMYARELFVSGADEDFTAAFPYFERSLHEEERSLEEVRSAQCVVARAARIKGNGAAFFKAALKHCLGEPSAEMCCELGECYLKMKDYEEAATWFYTAAFGVSSELNIHTQGDIALRGLARSYRGLGLEEAAVDYERQADEWKPPEKAVLRE